jgi:hypothetical protein
MLCEVSGACTWALRLNVSVLVCVGATPLCKFERLQDGFCLVLSPHISLYKYMSAIKMAFCCLLQIHFWGIDSGIRHSVGGADYGSVRVGAFMGLAICSQLASASIARSSSMSLAGMTKQQLARGTARALTATTSTAAAAAAAVAASSSSSGGAVNVASLSSGGFRVGSGWSEGGAPAAASAADGGGGGGDAGVLGGNGELGRSMRGSVGGRSSSSSKYRAGFGGYLANVSPSMYKELFEQQLPMALSGAEFLSRYGEHLDAMTVVDPGTRYVVREPTAHPIHENARVSMFRQLLAAAERVEDAATAAVKSRKSSSSGQAVRMVLGSGAGEGGVGGGIGVRRVASGLGGLQLHGSSSGSSLSSGDLGGTGGVEPHPQGKGAGAVGPGGALEEEQDEEELQQEQEQWLSTPQALLGPLECLGELMFQSHASYSACGLGSPGTNRLVSMVREHMYAARAAGKAPVLYGAKITGGGCGGTVCVMGLAGAAGQWAVEELVKRYAAETGHEAQVFGGSSVGAKKFGHLLVQKRAQAEQAP